MAKKARGYTVNGVRKALAVNVGGIMKIAAHEDCCCEPPTCQCNVSGCSTPPEYFCVLFCGDAGWCTGLGCGYVTCSHGVNCTWTGSFTSGDLSGKSITLYYSGGWKITISDCVTAKALSGFTCTGGYTDSVISITPIADPEDCPTCEGAKTCGCYDFPSVVAVTFDDIINCQSQFDDPPVCDAGCMRHTQCEGEGCCCPESLLNGQTFYVTLDGCSGTYEMDNCFYGNYEGALYKSSPTIYVSITGNDCQTGGGSVWARVYHFLWYSSGYWQQMGYNWLFASENKSGVTRATTHICGGAALTIDNATGAYGEPVDFRCGSTLCTNECKGLYNWGCGGYAQLTL